jgi:dipeptidase
LTEANDQIAAAITAKGKGIFDQLVKDNLNNSIYKYRP